ncbi:MAG: ATP-dependent 6-phosphofructokinase [Holosporales bacterium]|jgi:6-phosphofructokinase 1|nr:ATP-dependent 6-phosphofructokinase [Holosporales bacterium]
MKSRRIGILTSGGDCSGLNSAIRATYIRAKQLGYDLIGITRGLRGLAKDEPSYVALNDQLCGDSMLTSGGSILYSDTKFMASTVESGISVADARKALSNGYKKLGLDGLICVGGDGSVQLINELLNDNEDLRIVVIPKTIDNDVSGTDLAIGFQTSVEVVVSAVENIISTAKSHERAMVVEVMGRGAGHIAINAGLSSGADVILVPEFKYDIEKVKSKVMSCFNGEKNYCIIIVAESVEASGFKHKEEVIDGVVKYTHVVYGGIGQHLVNRIKETGIDSRCVTLGHIQRGGKTSVIDRTLGTMFGVEAVNLIDENNCGKLLCYVNNKICAIDIRDFVRNPTKTLTRDDVYVRIAKQMGVYIGET